MIEREQLEMDVVFVGAGPANLAAALHLKKAITEHDALVERGLKNAAKIGELEIGIIEKGSFVGAHILSGAVMDPIAIRELMPDFLEQGFPADSVVSEDAFWYLTQDKKDQIADHSAATKKQRQISRFAEPRLRMVGGKMRRSRNKYFPRISGRRIALRRKRSGHRRSHGR